MGVVDHGIVQVIGGEGCPQVRGAGVQQQTWIDRPSPSSAQKSQIVGTTLEFSRLQLMWRMNKIGHRVPGQAVETYGLIGPQVVDQLHISVIERNVGEGIVQPVA